MPGNSSSGGYGAIPYSIIMSKYEITCDDADTAVETELFQRNLLRDTGPDPISMASDAPRRNNMGRGLINLRTTGNLSGITDNYVPDKFMELTEREVRGTAVDPDFREYNKQTWSRESSLKARLMPDAPEAALDSVPSMGRSPHTVDKDRQAGLTRLLNTPHYLAVFSTSKDAWHNGGAAIPFRQVSRVGRNADSQLDKSNIHEFKDLTLEDAVSRAHHVTAMSNAVELGWQSTADHEFQVSNYGKVYKSRSLLPKDGEARVEAVHTQDFANSTQQIQRSALVILMDNIIHAKMIGMAPQTHIAGTSAEQAQRASRQANFIDEMLIRDLINRESATQDLESSKEMGTVNPGMPTFKGFTTQSTETNQELVHFMDTVVGRNALIAGKDPKSLTETRSKIQQDAYINIMGWDTQNAVRATQKPSNEDENKMRIDAAREGSHQDVMQSLASNDLSMKTGRTSNKHSDAAVMWEGLSSQVDAEDARVSSVYKNKIQRKLHDLKKVVAQELLEDSKIFGTKKVKSMSQTENYTNKRALAADHSMDEFDTKDRRARHLGRKYTRKLTDDSQIQHSDLMDI